VAFGAKESKGILSLPIGDEEKEWTLLKSKKLIGLK